MAAYIFGTAIVLLQAFVSATPDPQITPPAALQKRQSSVCGYYDDNDFNQYAITCDGGDKCVVATGLTPAVGYCSTSSILIPLTSLYDYTDAPATTSPGEGVCEASRPYAGVYDFNDGATIFLGCDVVPFSYTAYFGDNAVLTPITDTVLPSATLSGEVSISGVGSKASQTGSVPVNTGVISASKGSGSAQAATPTGNPNSGQTAQTSPSATTKGSAGSQKAVCSLAAVLAAVIPLLLVQTYI